MSTGPRRSALPALVRGVLLLLGLIVGSVLLAGPAAAHAELESSDPTDGATLDAVPAAVTLTFGEEIEPGLVRTRVDRPDGSQTAVDATTAGPVVTVPVGGPVASGQYSVVFRVVSQDGHPVSGTVDFTVEVTAEQAPTAEPTTSATALPTPTDVPAGPSAGPTSTPTRLDEQQAGATTSSATPWIVGGLGLLSVAIGGAAFVYVRSRQR